MIFRRRDGTLREDVPNTAECVLVDRDRGRVLALNATAAAVWDLLDGRRDVAGVARVLAEAAGEPDLARVEADVGKLLADLERDGFVLRA